MTSLKKLLAFNMKERRRILGLSQAALAERVNTSTHYIAMIELERKTPSLPMIERIAKALEIDSPEIILMQSIPEEALRTLQEKVLKSFNQDFGNSVRGILHGINPATATEQEMNDYLKKRFSTKIEKNG